MMNPAGVVGHHGEVHLPVLVPHRRWVLTRVVQEAIARRLVGLASEIVDLVDTIERGLDDAGILTGLDLLLQPVAFGTAGDFNERGHPVKGREDIVQDRARLDVPRPADDGTERACRLPRC